MQAAPERQLMQAIANGRAPHAVFLDCADTPLAAAMARQAAALFCFGRPDAGRLKAFPDYYELDEPLIKVDHIRELTGALASRPFGEGARAICIIDAHRMNENAQNALLKTLEEPPERTLFVLTGNRMGLLSTICSRCQTLRVAASPDAIIQHLTELGATRRDAESFACQGGTLKRAIALYTSEEYRQLRAASRDAFLSALEGRSAFNSTRALSGSVEDAVGFMLDAANELMRCREAIAPPMHDDAGRLLALASHFTSSQLNCIISLLADALKRYQLSHQGAAALDALFAGIGKTIMEA